MITSTLAKLLILYKYVNGVERDADGTVLDKIQNDLIQIIGIHEDECDIEEFSTLRHTIKNDVYTWKDKGGE